MINFDVRDLTDALASQIVSSTQADYELFLLDNGSSSDGISSFTTHRLEKNIGLSAGIDYLWNLVRDREDFDGYWFLCNDLMLDEGRDYLSELVATADSWEAKGFRIAAVTPSYHPRPGSAQPPFMVAQPTGGARPIVHLEWNALYVTRDFMADRFPEGFNLDTRHAFHDVVLSFEAWTTGRVCLVSDDLSLVHIENQTFVKRGGKIVNGTLVPDYSGLQTMLAADFDSVQAQYLAKGTDLHRLREVLHKDIDVRGDWQAYAGGKYPEPPSKWRALRERLFSID